jgi:23S rRNA (uracil1939-C5)-methyltransferase
MAVIKMARKNYIIPKVEITGTADRGKGVGRTAEGLVLFVDGAVPGDVVDVYVQKKKPEYAEGLIQVFHVHSPHRIEPFCKHFEICGGCKWQNLSYASQLEHKQKIVEDSLRRIGKVEIKEFLPILGAPKTTYYRNKLEFAFANRRWLTREEINAGIANEANVLGFHKAGAFDKLIDIDHCWLQEDPSNALRNGIRKIALAQNLVFYDMRKNIGYLRHIMMRLTSTGELMLIVSIAENKPEQLKSFLDAILTDFKDQITTLIYCINEKMNDFIYDLPMHTYHGKGYVEEILGDLTFKIGPKSFFQTNSYQAKYLYDLVVQFAGLTGNENVYDLYTGTGSIALYVAKYCKQVVGIEEVPEAIVDAEENMRRNNIENAIFYAGDVKNVLTPEFAALHGKPDLIITDPPRSGMHEKAVRFLLELAAPRIVYVSCNPATQARDLQILSAKYDVLKVQPVDMFPHTHHIENVALLQLK